MKKIIPLVVAAALGVGFASAAEAHVSVGIGIGIPVEPAMATTAIRTIIAAITAVVITDMAVMATAATVTINSSGQVVR
jgi:hypothetical protein